MKLVDRYHCNDIEPFITVNNSADTNEDSNKPNEDQHDFTLERFFFYNDYLKSLYVLSMVYEACLSCEDLLQVGQKNKSYLKILSAPLKTSFIFIKELKILTCYLTNFRRKEILT